MVFFCRHVFWCFGWTLWRYAQTAVRFVRIEFLCIIGVRGEVISSGNWLGCVLCGETFPSRGVRGLELSLWLLMLLGAVAVTAKVT
jgi:hypothetical protein